VEGEQQDAQEFLQTMLHCVQESTKEINAQRKRWSNKWIGAEGASPADGSTDVPLTKKLRVDDEKENSQQRKSSDSRLSLKNHKVLGMTQRRPAKADLAAGDSLQLKDVSVNVIPLQLDIPFMKAVADPVENMFQVG
jgi:hypothetical protein